MNRSELFHNERKEYWRELIRQCDASGRMQKDWCQENGICSTSMSKWCSLNVKPDSKDAIAGQ